MKKIIAVMLLVLMLFALGACGKGSDNTEETTKTPEPTSNKTDATGDTTIDWKDIPDDEILGAWKYTSMDDPGVVLFTTESTLRVVYGSTYLEADIKYGVDGDGNKSAYTDGNVLYGQWTYVIEEDTLTIMRPVDDMFEEYTLERVDYTPLTIEAKSGFEADADLVGKWISLMDEEYEFRADGIAVYTREIDDGVNAYTQRCDYSYFISDNSITLFSVDVFGEEQTETYEYSIDGTVLDFGGIDFYLNGEDMPEPSAEITE